MLRSTHHVHLDIWKIIVSSRKKVLVLFKKFRLLLLKPELVFGDPFNLAECCLNSIESLFAITELLGKNLFFNIKTMREPKTKMAVCWLKHCVAPLSLGFCVILASGYWSLNKVKDFSSHSPRNLLAWIVSKRFPISTPLRTIIVANLAKTSQSVWQEDMN